MPKPVDIDEKRAEFVGASWRLIAREGLGAASLRRVASEAGCTTGSLTHYFANRKELLVESLRAVHYQAADRMRMVMKRTPDDLQRLHGVLLESLPLDDVRLKEWRVWLAFWAAAMMEPELAAENDRRYMEWRKSLRRALRPLTNSPADADREAFQLIALTDGLGLSIARHTGSRKDLEKRQRECETALLHYLDKFKHTS